MADLQVSLALLLENQEEVARELERAGGIAGKDFGAGLSEGAKKSLDDLIAQATAAAKKVGLIFNQQKFQFETVRGEIVPAESLKNIAQVNKEFKAAQNAVQAFKSALSTTTKIDDRSIAGLSKKLADLQNKQTFVNVDSKEFVELQREIDVVNKDLTKIQSRRILIDADASSILLLTNNLQEKLESLRQKRVRVKIDSEDFEKLTKEIIDTEKELKDLNSKQVLVDFDKKSLQGLQSKLNDLQSKQTKIPVDSADFIKLQKEINNIKNEIDEANKKLININIDPKSIQALSSRLNDLRTKQTKVAVDSTDFKELEVEINKIQKEIEDIGQKKILLNVDPNSVASLAAKLEAQIRDLRQRRLTISVDASEFKTLSREINKAERELKQLRQTVGDFDEFNILESAVTGASISLTNRISDALLITLGSVRNLVGGFLELDAEIRLAAAAAGEQGGYQKLGTVIEKVGIEAAGTSKQVAELATSLVRAGFTVDEVSKALPGVVRGAEATGTGFEQFGEITGNALRAFGLDVKETSRVVDVLVNAANSSNASIESLGYTFEYSASTAKTLGVSLEDLAAATGLLANVGIKGTVAGTGLREALQKLQQAAGGASPEVMGLAWNQTRLMGAMQKIGAAVIDAQGKLLPLEQVFLRLKEGLEKLSQVDQIQLADILFGDQAGQKVLAITNQTSDAIVKMFGDMKNSAGATDIARTAMSGAKLEIMQLQGTVDALGNKLGEVTVIGMRPLVAAGNALTGAIAGMPGPIKTTVSALIVLAGAAAAATVGLTALNMIVKQTGGWAILATNAKQAAVSIAGIGGTAVMIIGAAAAFAVFTGAVKETDEASKSLLQTMVGLGTAVATFRTLTTFKVPPVLTAILSLGAGIAAYSGIGSQIKTTNSEITQLTDETKALEEEISSLQAQITESKELGISTELAEKRIEKLSIKLQDLKGPLEIKLDLQKAESQVETLRNKLKINWQVGLSSDYGRPPADAIKGTEMKFSQAQAPLFYDRFSIYGTKTGSAEEPLQLAQFAAAERIRDIYKQIQQNNAKGIVGSAARKDAEEINKLSAQINELKLKATKLPLSAKIEREEIDKQLGEIRQKIEGFKARIKISANTEEVLLAVADVQRQLSNTNLTEEERNNLEKALLMLISEKLKLQKEEIANADKLNKIKSQSKDQLLTEARYYEKLIEGTRNAANEQLAAGKITKSQAEENIRMVELQQLQAKKALALKEIAEQRSKGGDTASTESEIYSINEKIVSLMEKNKQAALEKELSLIQVQKGEYAAILAQRLADKDITTQQYENELRYLERIALEREKASRQAQLKLVDPNTQEGLDLRSQIATLDKSLAENRLATAKAVSEKIAQEVDSYSTLVDLASKRVDVENQGREQAKNGYDLELQLVQAITDNARARQELIRSEYDIRAAGINLELADAQEGLANLQEKQRNARSKDERNNLNWYIERQERRIADIKNAASENAIRAKKAELDGLRQQERLENAALDLKQKMMILDQQSRIAQSRFSNNQAAVEWKKTLAKAKDPNLSPEQRKDLEEMAKIQEEAIRLTAQDVSFQQEKLELLKEIHKIEKETQTMNQQARRNRTFAELVSLGGARFAGGDVVPSKKYAINEIGKESFLSDSGRLSWINQPAYSLWRPPSRGVVIPANVSEYLAEIGALPGGRGGAGTGAGGSSRLDHISHSIGVAGNVADTITRQSLAMGRLQKSIDKLAAKDWNVHVPIASNAKLLRTVGGF